MHTDLMLWELQTGPRWHQVRACTTAPPTGHCSMATALLLYMPVVPDPSAKSTQSPGQVTVYYKGTHMKSLCECRTLILGRMGSTDPKYVGIRAGWCSPQSLMTGSNPEIKSHAGPLTYAVFITQNTIRSQRDLDLDIYSGSVLGMRKENTDQCVWNILLMKSLTTSCTFWKRVQNRLLKRLDTKRLTECYLFTENCIIITIQ